MVVGASVCFQHATEVSQRGTSRVALFGMRVAPHSFVFHCRNDFLGSHLWILRSALRTAATVACIFFLVEIASLVLRLNDATELHLQLPAC